jgi:hypothetical protein
MPGGVGMARRRVVYPVDTSDWLANMVLGFLIVAAIALVGLMALVCSETGIAVVCPADQDIAAREATTEVPTAAGGTATVVPSPTSVPQVEDEPDDAVAGDPGVDETVDEPATVPTTDPGTREPSTASEPVTPLRPRGDRSDAAETAPPVVPPVPDESAPGDTTPGDTTPEEPVPGDTTPDAVPDADGGTGQVSPDVDEPLGPSSPLDDPDRVPMLVLSDAPIDVHTVVADLDGDRVRERVWAALIRNVVHVRVQHDTDGGWVDVARATGADADDLVSLEAEDLTGDGRLEIHTRQWVGVNGESVSLWSFANDRLLRMTGNGGCWDGENTFGLVGARVEFGRVRAICEEDPLPPYLWSTAVYRWVDGMWTYQQRVSSYG